MSKDGKSAEKYRDLYFLTPPSSSKFNDSQSISSETPSEIILESRINHGSRWSACKAIIVNYGRNSNIHGVRYVFEMHRPFYEKFFWLIFLIISAYFAGLLIRNIYRKFEQTPIIIGFDEKLVPVHAIPFPAVTICPETKIDRTFFNFTNISQNILEEIEKYKSFKNYENYTREEINNFASLLHICETDVINQFSSYMPNDAGSDVAFALVNISMTKNLTAPGCQWNRRFYLCEKILNFVATDEGICLQFNGLKGKDIYRDPRYVSYIDSSEHDFNSIRLDIRAAPLLNNITGSWSLDTGYIGQGHNSYPQRTIFASVRSALFTYLEGWEHNLEYSCRSFTQGYKVFINSPDSVPLTTGNYILVPHGEEIMVKVIPQYITSTKNLHDFIPEKRQCYFNDERYLRYFRFYSQSNCQTECLVNFTISKCGCAKFWMPKPLDVPVCRLPDFNCYNNAHQELTLVLQNQSIQKAIDPRVNIMCDCMPGCTSLDYNFEISSVLLDSAKVYKAFREPMELQTGLLGSRLLVYFKEHQFTAMKRSVLFSVTTLISNTGGLCGLFLGLTLFSIIEFVYFFSFRLFENLRIRWQKKQQKAVEKKNQLKAERRIIWVK